MIDHLSYSQIQEYLTCQRSYRHKYIDKVETESNEALLFGSAWHRMISRVIDGGILLESWDLACVNTFERMTENYHLFELGNTMLQSQSVINTLEELKPYHQSGIKTRKLAWAINGVQEVLTLEPMIDHYIEYKIPHVDVPIIGYIDMIADDRVPVDFKTAGRKWDQKQADLSLQPTFYLAGLHYQGFLKANDFPAKFRYIIFLKKPPYDVQVIETTRTASDIITLFGLIADCYEAIEKEVFLPTGASGWKCSENYCDFWQLCKGGTKNEKL